MPIYNDLIDSGIQRIVGADEAYAADVAPINGKNSLSTNSTDIANTSCISGAISVNTYASAIRVGSSNLVNRKMLCLANMGPQTLYWGYSASVTAATGIPLFKFQVFPIGVGPNITLYAVTETGTASLRISEFS